jgi:hypothetical protein
LLTQTNVIWAVERGTVPLEEAAAWIEAGVAPFFDGRRGTMKFSGSIWYMRRTSGGDVEGGTKASTNAAHPEGL